MEKIATQTTKTFTNAKGITFDLGDFGPNSQYNRYAASYKPFSGRLGETFKVVFTAHTRKELREKMEAYG